MSLVATDAGGNVATQSFSLSVTNVNDAPTFTTTPVQQAFVNAVYTYEFAASDEDAGDAVSFAPATALPSSNVACACPAWKRPRRSAC